jgi:2-keto-myo-inositol isomerase
MHANLSRRAVLKTAALMTLAGAMPALGAQGAPMFKYCLNTSTIAGQKLTLPRQVEVTAEAGYQGIEPWIRDIESFLNSGGSLAELRKRIADLGLGVESAIGFARWIVDDDAERRKGMEMARRDMDWLAQIGGTRIAAPPAGAHGTVISDLGRITERYLALLELGEKMGVVPQVEIWGGSRTLGKLEDAIEVARQSGHPRACILSDVYHMYKGGSPFELLKTIPGPMLQVLHMNDYPANPPREKIGDADRVYPTDGIAPLGSILTDVAAANPRCVLSLELFNRTYYQQDALEVARTGLAKMKAAVAAMG